MVRFYLNGKFYWNSSPAACKFCGYQCQQYSFGTYLRYWSCRSGGSAVGCFCYRSKFNPRSNKTHPKKLKKIDLNVAFHSWDVEDLPFEVASFDVVISQFGHLFSHRPSVALSEMLRDTNQTERLLFQLGLPRCLWGAFFKLMRNMDLRLQRAQNPQSYSGIWISSGNAYRPSLIISFLTATSWYNPGSVHPITDIFSKRVLGPWRKWWTNAHPNLQN